MNDKGQGQDKSLTDRVKEVLQDLLEALDQLLTPPPRLVPVRVRGARGR